MNYVIGYKRFQNSYYSKLVKPIVCFGEAIYSDMTPTPKATSVIDVEGVMQDIRDTASIDTIGGIPLLGRDTDKLKAILSPLPIVQKKRSREDINNWQKKKGYFECGTNQTIRELLQDLGLYQD